MFILQNGQRFTEHKYQLEADFDKEISDSQKAVFGKDTIYIDAKRKIGSEALGWDRENWGRKLITGKSDKGERIDNEFYQQTPSFLKSLSKSLRANI